jgi:long-chain acyl-CoA synthetase
MDQVRKGVRLSNLMLKVGIDKRRTFFKEILDNFGGELKYIISGGAHLDPFYVKAFRDWGIEIRNGYGTTECSPCVAINRNYYNRDGSVGQLIEGTQARAAEDGEIQLKGSVVMKGYYNDPEATAEVLQDGWYSTGDLGYVDKDGFLFLTGRKKNLIILSNGENISPEELENDLHLDPAVNEVLVYDKDSRIVAEIYPEEEYMGNEDYFNNLVNEVNKGRPAYKQIAKVVLRDTEFIKNSSKKIVRYKNIPR